MITYEPQWSKWVSNGRRVTKRSVPEEVKWFVIETYAKERGLSTLIETGTAIGDTLLHVHSFFEKIYSFELMRSYYEVALANLRGLDNITLFNASSASEEFKGLVNSLEEPALFYLDAHFSGEGTGQDKALETPDVPVREELKIIRDTGLNHVIIIDDARCFKGERFHSSEYKQYPSADELEDIMGEPWALTSIADAFVLEKL